MISWQREHALMLYIVTRFLDEITAFQRSVLGNVRLLKAQHYHSMWLIAFWQWFLSYPISLQLFSLQNYTHWYSLIPNFRQRWIEHKGHVEPARLRSICASSLSRAAARWTELGLNNLTRMPLLQRLVWLFVHLTNLFLVLPCPALLIKFSK